MPPKVPKVPDDAKVRKLLQAIEIGNYLPTAARYAGIGEAAFYAVMEHGRTQRRGRCKDFHDRVMDAEAKAEVAAVAALRRGFERDWRAAAEFLRRKYPSRWAEGDKIQLDITALGARKLEEDGLDDFDLNPEQVEVLGRQLSQIESGRLPPPKESGDDEYE